MRRGARITPTQKRSRERMERILSVATELIAATGSDAMRMSEVAERSGISIGSLYQYFPDKRAIIAALAERYHETSRACISEDLADVQTLGQFRDAFSALIETYYQLFLEQPAMRDVWSGTQADKTLLDIELLNSRENGDLVASTLAKLMPAADEAALATKAFLVMSLGEATMRLAISVTPEEGRLIVETYKRMALKELTSK
ncbi:TetR/AcrR family transcriptional regulator [Chelativorans salis]|uniref:TetR family transcriptional regulator n=1 Tax=Chelativorans salis TaxID=2978478 RepID=A0ABT2LTS2_9HYPH|nr:TetR/AcrR family transcriptional regulator [Chelativorans sp. EGI FJ00035]MCT7377932.1 TetR family transcriptional regulator [Chelativorans sp. EGI FJ00035]